MRIAIYNEFFGENFAETELAERICLAAKNLGWESIEVASSIEIKKFNPDFVLVLHFKTPKLTGFPTYGCMWNPPDFFDQYEIAIKREKAKENILSYDAYLSSSVQINTWLKDILFGTNKKFFIAPFYTSCHQTQYQMPSLDNPHLVYIGTNWDGTRFQELFQHLDTKDYMEIYGPQKAWKHLKHSYKGLLPFDGTSVLNTLNKAGLGLCLHKEEHRISSIPSMRIFEIVASGAVAICEQHPFIKESFGDSVFYISSDLSPIEKVNQISRYVRWIQNNQKDALAMSAEAHKIFTEKYSFENLLLGIVQHHKKLIREKGFLTTFNNTKRASDKSVEIIVRVGDRDASMVKRCLDSIASQVYNNIGVIIVKYKQLDYLDSLLKDYEGKFPIKTIETEFSGFRSTQMIAGINAVDAEYFGILDDDDSIHPNHIYSLVSLLEKSNEIGVAYSGSIRVWESNESDFRQINKHNLLQETSELAYFEPFDINKLLIFNNFITSNSFIARSSLIDEDLKHDPELRVAEDMFLLLNLCRKTKFIFTYEATCEFYWRSSKAENSTFEGNYLWEESIKRIRHMFWKKSFPSSRFILSPVDINSSFTQANSNIDLEELQFQLQYTLNVIEAIKTSKFWKLRNAWFQLKKALKIPMDDQLL
ncbi:glycosyltransferase [Anabaena catenula]|uniref:Glycosyltransferase family 2 protein n=1 Tax=Anabaena catenula FACHB-362 TaxID=2692877 RepID=A0ABR8J6A4_9NOST|nr:glycosyltransferase family A protein [Anabaena catenula]MBD2692561.1 glycosyltransferase family 2 protein [Anabaena catenula FACHB-362]